MKILHIISSISIYLLYFYFPFHIKLTIHLKFTVSDGGYVSDDVSIWSEEDEQTTEDINNYGEHLTLFLKGCLKLTLLFVEYKTLKNN